MLPKYTLVMQAHTHERSYAGKFFDHDVKVVFLSKGKWQAQTAFLPPLQPLKKERSLDSLFDAKGLPALMGLCKFTELKINELYDVDVVWIEQPSRKELKASLTTSPSSKKAKRHRQPYHPSRSKSGRGPTLPPRKEPPVWNGQGPAKGAWYE